MLIKRALNKESSYEISLKLDGKFNRGISYSGHIVFSQFLRNACFSSAVCPLQVPGWVKEWAPTSPFSHKRNRKFSNLFGL